MTHGATKMEDLNDKGLYLDELQKLRVIEPDAAEQAKDMKDECGGLMQQTEDFRKMTDQFIALTEQVANEVEKEKLAALGARNKLKSTTESRKQQQQQLTSVIFEKKTEMERLRLQYESLLKAQAEQQEFIDQFQK